MKLLRYITVLFISLFGFWNVGRADAGNISIAPSYTVSVTDTAGPSTETVVNDTIEPVGSSVNELLGDTAQPAGVTVDVIVADTNFTDPPASGPGTTASVSMAEGGEDNPASDVYEDFDTTMVHAEKFDALTFNDTVKIPLNDPAHCEYVMPFNGRLTSTFAFRSYRYHFGVDIDLETGDTVRCAFDGKVRIAQKSKTYGYVVVVRHSNGLETYYAHLSKLLVHPNEDLEAGSVLGLGGNTGHSHGSHLHFEVRYGGQPIDPNYLIDFKNGKLRTDTYNLCKSDFKYLAKTYKVRHYSKKKKKTWYTYYTPGGAHYSTTEAKRIMAAVPDPVMPGGDATPTKDNGTFDAGTSTVATKTTTTTAVKTSSTASTKTSTTASTKTSTTAVRQTLPAGAVYYTIKSGDTLYALALKNNTTVAKLCALNNISSTSTLKIGQKIRLK